MLWEPSCPASLSPFLPPIYLFPEWRLRRAARRWPRLAFPLSPVVSASAHSHTQAAAEASDIAPGAEKGIFSSVVNVIYFVMFKCNKGKAGFALPTCMKLGVRCRIALCALSVFWWARSAASTSFPTIN